MNMIAKLALAAVVGALALSGPANAQSATAGVNGDAMKSTQNQPYQPLTDGEAVNAGDAIMVSPNSSVVLNVTDGTRSWQVTLPPGTYRITPGLLRTASGAPIASQTRGNLAFSVGTIVGVALVGAAALDSMDEVPPLNPVSR